MQPQRRQNSKTYKTILNLRRTSQEWWRLTLSQFIVRLSLNGVAINFHNVHNFNINVNVNLNLNLRRMTHTHIVLKSTQWLKDKNHIAAVWCIEISRHVRTEYGNEKWDLFWTRIKMSQHRACRIKHHEIDCWPVDPWKYLFWYFLKRYLGVPRFWYLIQQNCLCN